MSYDQFRSTRAARTAYGRARSIKHFILTGRENPPCACCGKPIHDFSGADEDGKPLHLPGYQNNRCTYLRTQNQENNGQALRLRLGRYPDPACLQRRRGAARLT